MGDRIYKYELKCGCLVSSDKGGGLIDCMSDKCSFNKWVKTKEGKKHLKEVEENNH